MADGNEDMRADDLPGPAYESYESMELACPAERSGHVAVGDGRHMFVWGGYKVSGRPAAPVPESGSAGGLPPPPRVATLPVGAFSCERAPPDRCPDPRRRSRAAVTPALCLRGPRRPRALWTLERCLGEGTLGGARLRDVFYFKRLGGGGKR